MSEATLPANIMPQSPPGGWRARPGGRCKTCSHGQAQ